MINIGVLGLGTISKRVAQGILLAKDCQLLGGASQDFKKSKSFQMEFITPKFYSSYQAMYVDDEIDLIYIATPDFTHFDFIKEGLQHKKHIICEKMMVQSEEECDELFDLAQHNNCFLMEAHKTLFTPLNLKIKEMIDEGVIGDIKVIDAQYSYHFTLDNSTIDHWILREDTGGCSVDVGVYPLVYANYMANSDIEDFIIEKLFIPGYYCDFGFRGQIEYQNDVIAHVSCDWFHTPPYKGQATIVGDKGSIVTDAFWKNTEATLLINNESHRIECPFESEFTGEVEHAIDCIQKGLLESPIMSREQSKRLIRIIRS